jgi:parallel beta-helix repeat protein
MLVRSWDPIANHPDRLLRDGRPTIAVRERGRLDASYTTFARLGFYRGTVSGFALWAHPPNYGTGTVRDSRFVNNYNGAFTYGARDMRWVHNRFEHNIVYGLDPHTGSSDFLVERNYAARNGRHGIIFSRDCFRNVIRDNVTEHNHWHGIVIDDGKFGNGPSNYNVVVDNVVRDNSKVGIQLDGSAHNLIRGNQITGSRQGIRVIGPADRNIIAGNSVGGARDFGLILHAPSRRTLVTGNTIFGTPTGVRIHGSADATVKYNRIVRVLSHAVKVDDAGRTRARDILIAGNQITGSGTSPVRISTRITNAAEQRGNRVSWNYPLLHNIAYALRTDVGPGLWVLLLMTAIAGPLLFAFARLLRKRRFWT